METLNVKVSPEESDRMEDEDCVSKSQSTISITLERASYTEEKFTLYTKYQTNIHDKPGEVYTPESFSSFLVDSPLFDERVDPSDVPHGTMHQLYRLEEVGIASLCMVQLH